MKTNLCIATIAAGALLGPIESADAGVRIRLPFVRVETNDYDGVYVRAPFVRVGAPVAPPAAYFVEPAPVVYPAVPPPAAVPANPAPVAVPAWSHRDFARSFQPVPGTHEADFVHPYTQQVVRVRFRLPNDRLEKVKADRDRIVFEYDDSEVEIKFRRNGTVAIDYDD